jgi:hypothetical protein
MSTTSKGQTGEPHGQLKAGGSVSSPINEVPLDHKD